MYIIHIEHNLSGLELISVATTAQSGRLDNIKLRADYMAALMPSNMTVAVRHHRTGECVYTVKGKFQ